MDIPAISMVLGCWQDEFWGSCSCVHILISCVCWRLHFVLDVAPYFSSCRRGGEDIRAWYDAVDHRKSDCWDETIVIVGMVVFVCLFWLFCRILSVHHLSFGEVNETSSSDIAFFSFFKVDFPGAMLRTSASVVVRLWSFVGVSGPDFGRLVIPTCNISTSHTLYPRKLSSFFAIFEVRVWRRISDPVVVLWYFRRVVMGCSSSSSNFTRASSSKFLDTTIEWLMCNIFHLGSKPFTMIPWLSHLATSQVWKQCGGCLVGSKIRQTFLVAVRIWLRGVHSCFNFRRLRIYPRGRDHGSQTLAHVVFHLFPIVTLLSPGPSLSPRHLLTWFSSHLFRLPVVKGTSIFRERTFAWVTPSNCFRTHNWRFFGGVFTVHLYGHQFVKNVWSIQQSRPSRK